MAPDGHDAPRPSKRIALKEAVRKLKTLWDSLPQVQADSGKFLEEDRFPREFFASQARFPEVWANDRHMLRAAQHFGLMGRSV